MADAVGAYLGIKTRYTDIIRPKKDYDAREVVDSVIAKAGLEVSDEPSRPDGENRD